MSTLTRVALVTGAAQGIGRAISLRLAKDGFNVAVSDLPRSRSQLESLTQEIKGKGRQSTWVLADVTSEPDVKSLVEKVAGDLGSLDVFVANAGVCKAQSFLDTSVDDWENIFKVNGRGAFLSYKYAAQQMVAQGKGGRIIGASSVAGKRGEPFLAAYSASKFAVRGLTQAAALELGQYGITVNAYAPGAIDTPMLEGISSIAGTKDEFYAHEAKNTVLNRVGHVDDIAGLVSYLASPDASWVTGKEVPCSPDDLFTNTNTTFQVNR
ncbi:acetoin reductase family protein [Pluteus cervinus]|uniref:Acetoin reductase family protein n=1 Tax=Pluteus cervinus TaxID=181527 RepID=A0ACD3AEM1_9AGAR|nr:acetoin reductase family protein [Pluteus cervinus]